MTKEIATRRIMLKPSFQDFDPIQTNHVTFEQFTRALTKLGLNLPDYCFKILARNYMDKNNIKEVNYADFVEDVDKYYKRPPKWDLESAALQPKPNFTDFILPVTDYTAPHHADGDDLINTGIGVNKNKDKLKFDELLNRLRSEVVMKRVRIKEYFRDIDKLRKGYCSADQFRRILQLTGIVITDHQMFLLYDHYRLEDGLINYKRFTEDIELVWTKPNIEQNPLEKVDRITEDSTLMARRDYFDFDGDHDRKLDMFLAGIKKEIDDRRILLRPHFQDFDRVRNGYVTKNQFLRVLNQFDI